MGSTNKTPTYELSQFVSTDKFKRTDWNSDMLKIDTIMKETNDALLTAQNDATMALEEVALAQETANNAVESIGSNADPATVKGRIKTVEDKIDITEVKPGIVQMYAGDAPTTGWLLCDGQAVLRSTYAALFAVIGVKFGIGDGVNTFNVPDFRGIFPKGAGVSGKYGTDYDGGTVGTYKQDQIQDHAHGTNPRGDGGNGNLIGSASGGTYYSANTNGMANGRIGATTEPASLSLNFIIKY